MQSSSNNNNQRKVLPIGTVLERWVRFETGIEEPEDSIVTVTCVQKVGDKWMILYDDELGPDEKFAVVIDHVPVNASSADNHLSFHILLVGEKLVMYHDFILFNKFTTDWRLPQTPSPTNMSPL